MTTTNESVTKDPRVYCFFDTETDGLIRNGYRERLIQLAYIITDDNFNPLRTSTTFCIPNGVTFIDQGFHKFSLGTVCDRSHGKTAHEAVTEFIADLAKYNVTNLVAHNITFDLHVIRKERVKDDGLLSIQQHCTMRHPKGRWKTLVELYDELVGGQYEAHDALQDAMACMQCYIKLKQLEKMK